MASLTLCSILNFLIFSLFSTFVASQGGAGGGVAARALWCVARNDAEDSALQPAIDWACGPGGANCQPIQNNGPCYDPSDLQRTASYAFNDYYRKHSSSPSDDSCSFSNTAALTSINPSHGNCIFPSSLTTGDGNSSSVPERSESAALSSNSSEPPSPIVQYLYWGINVFLFFVFYYQCENN